MAQHTRRAFRNSTYIKHIYYMARDTMTIQVPMTTKTLHNIYFNNYWLTATLGMQHSHTTVQQLHNTIFHNYWLPWCVHELHGFWRNISSHTQKQLYNHMLTSTYYIILRIKYSLIEARWSLLIQATNYLHNTDVFPQELLNAD